MLAEANSLSLKLTWCILEGHATGPLGITALFAVAVLLLARKKSG
ncbi:hypothetical protein [Bradyrhizobium sp. UFLA03-84]|nr:hypothetical protein [Bradyrhizobium sp. UFLA03-84]